MLNYLKQQADRTRTENGASAYSTTRSDCLDLFATVGALRGASESEIEVRFVRAFTEDKSLAMKLLFFARDVRGGLGERRVFRVILNWLAKNEPESLRKNVRYIAEYGRYDDLLALIGTPCESFALTEISAQLRADLAALENGGSVSLLGKWLPSVNTSNAEAVRMGKLIARYLKMSDAQYRKTLVKLRAAIRIIENDLREKSYLFDYEKQPSKALYKYRAAFMRNDGERYNEFLNKVQKGEARLHTDTLAPYELVEPYFGDAYGDSFMRPISADEKKVLNATWASLPDYGYAENMLAVVDTSGSMYWDNTPTPASVALSLGLYIAEHNKGAYADHFIEFSAKPRLIEIKGETFADRLRYVASFNEVANTDLAAVFDLILGTAVKNNVPDSELPRKLIIISDMEFDYCVGNADATVFENAKQKYEAKGYTLPEIVFWNVASRNRQQPVTKNEQGVALVSGCTPKLFSQIASGFTDPYGFMMEILGSERYACIAA